MEPINFPESNGPLGRPKGTTAEQCADLRVWRGTQQVDAAGTRWPVIISAWKLSPEEMKLINDTGIIYLSVTGLTMPPVMLYVENILEGVNNNPTEKEQGKMYFKDRYSPDIFCFPTDCELYESGIISKRHGYKIPFINLEESNEEEYNLQNQKINN